MSQLTSSSPRPGTKLKVIGAGLPRSGTNSFCAAVTTLLGGPAYQAAAQCALSDTSDHVLALIAILKLKASIPEGGLTASKISAELSKALCDETDGWIVTADAPWCLFVPELMDIYPDAIVVCTVRERTAWAKSMWKAAKLGNPTVLSWLYFWVPVLCYSPRMWGAQGPVWKTLYGRNLTSEEATLETWDRHNEWLRRIVPKEKLFFVDVNDGWEPLCRALGKPVPVDIPFPKLNDGQALEATMRSNAIRGLAYWLILLVTAISLPLLLWSKS